MEPGNHPGKTKSVVSFSETEIDLMDRAAEHEGDPVRVAALFAFSTSWPREGFLTPSGIVFLIN